MSLKYSLGRIWLEDAAGAPVFDSAAGMFRAMRFASGFMDLPARTATSTPFVVTPVNVDVTYMLATIPLACNTAVGMVQFARTPAGQPDPAGRWQAVNGSKLDIDWKCGPLNSINAPTDYMYTAGVGWLTFTAAAGALTLREELTLRAPQGASGTYVSTRPATRVHYRLFCGALK